MPKEAKAKTPSTRKPTAYQIFMSSEIKKVKAANPALSHKEAFKTATQNWSKQNKTDK